MGVSSTPPDTDVEVVEVEDRSTLDAWGRGRAPVPARLAACAQLAAASPFSDWSRPLAERLGFVALHRWTPWTRPRS